MVDKQKLIIMSKLAAYDKDLGKADKLQDEYYRGDYVYKKNLWTRFFALLGAAILLGLYYVYRIFILEADIFQLDYMQELTNAGTFIVAVLAIYTIIGTILATIEYYLSQKRLKEYFALIRKLDKHTKESPENIGEDTVS